MLHFSQARGSLHVHMAIWVSGEQRRKIDPIVEEASQFVARTRAAGNSDDALTLLAGGAASLRRNALVLPFISSFPDIGAARNATAECDRIFQAITC